MNVTRRTMLAAAPAGAALAALTGINPAGADAAIAAPPAAVPPDPAGQARWLVALRSGLARWSTP